MALLLSPVLCMQSAWSARVDDLYSATVPLSPNAANPLNDAFGRALGEVLVKVTGLPDAGSAAARVGVLSDAGKLVQQYSRLPGNKLSARFDPRAVRRALDAGGLPVWAENRPLVAIWLAVDTGAGRRLILSEGSDESERTLAQVDELRDALLQSADSRGLPMVLPLVDAQDLGVVTFADIWGDFPGPVTQASQRYGADAILIGRTRSADVANDQVRWTLTIGNERAAWQGTIVSGPAQAADILAQRLATYADSAGTLRVLVRNVDTLEQYGQLRKYFAGLSIVEQSSVAHVNANDLEFELVVRGDAQRLERTLNRSRLLQPISSESDTLETGRPPDLVYAWASDPG